MNIHFSHIIAKYYDALYNLWRHKRVSPVLSNIVAAFFIAGLIISILYQFDIGLPAGQNKYLGIELAFTVLLTIEVLGLIFALPDSVSESVGKQFEIVSLILLRNSFKEFGHLPNILEWNTTTLSDMLPMMSDAFGALMLFLITGLFYKAQTHTPITATDEEQKDFESVKKVIALAILVLFVVFGVKDLYHYFFDGSSLNSFHTFFNVLVFTDVMILIYSLRFSSKYINLFRYSSYTFATIILRLSLTAPAFYNVALCLLAGLFVLAVTYVYNYLMKKTAPEQMEPDQLNII